MTRYRQMHRHARRARRAGMQPTLIISPGDQFPELVSVAAAQWLTRWAYRHRTAFVPFGIVAATFAVASYTHPHHARYWLPAAGVTVLAVVLLGIPHRILRARPTGMAAAAALARLWAECGIDRGAEQAYAAVVVAVTGGWLSAAIAVGPRTRPLPLVAGVATVITAIPWWFHRRRRARARAEKTISAWPRVADDSGLPGSDILSLVVDTWGWTARVLLRKGNTTEQAISRIPALEAGLGLRPGSMRVFPDPARADKFIMRVIETDPHAQPIPWPGQCITSVTMPMDIGVSEGGRPARILLLRRSALIGGIMGSGKSGILNLIIANLASCRDVILWGIDMKGGMELRPWADCFSRLAFTPQQATGLFRDAVERLNERAARMAAEGKRIWEPAPADPALIIIVDEYAELPYEAQRFADSVGRRGRAVAVSLIAATQRPTQAAMGSTAVRSQMDIRICLRVRESRDTDLVLGQGMVTSGWHAHKLTQPGTFLICGPEHTIPERNRAYELTDTRRDQHASQCARLRPWLPASRPDAPPAPQTAGTDPFHGDGQPSPEMTLWDALADAGPEGVSIAVLEAACGLTRRWIYYRLQEHARAGRAVQVRRGYWKAARPAHDPERLSSDGE